MNYANELIVERLRGDRDVLREYLKSAIEGLFNNEVGVSLLQIRNVVNATIGFPDLAEALGYKDKGKTLMGMLTGDSNPKSSNIFAIIRQILDNTGFTFAEVQITDKAA